MAGDSKAKVIPLHSNSGRAAAQRRAGQRTQASRQHPSLLSEPGTRASSDQIAAVVREIDQHRRAAGHKSEADESGNELARKVSAVADFLRHRIAGDYRVDEFGFDKIEHSECPEAGHLLYKVIAARTQKRSTALVTNVDFEKWVDYLSDGPLAMALLDRLVRGAIIMKLKGKSYGAENTKTLENHSA